MATNTELENLKENLDAQLQEVRRNVDLARETVPKGVPLEDYLLAILGEREKTFHETVKRLEERGNAQDHLAEVIAKNAEKNVDTANTAAKEAIGRTEAYARETIGRVEQVATLNDKNANDKIDIIMARMNSWGGQATGTQLTIDRIIAVLSVAVLIYAALSGHLH